MTTNGKLVRICGVSELPREGELSEIEAGEESLCVARINGEIAVLDNICSHRGGPLAQGYVSGGNVICPWHAFAFDPKTGVCVNVNDEQVRVFEVTVSGDDVLVTL